MKNIEIWRIDSIRSKWKYLIYNMSKRKVYNFQGRIAREIRKRWNIKQTIHGCLVQCDLVFISRSPFASIVFHHMFANNISKSHANPATTPNKHSSRNNWNRTMQHKLLSSISHPVESKWIWKIKFNMADDVWIDRVSESMWNVGFKIRYV